MNANYTIIDGDVYIKASDMLCILTNRILFIKRTAKDEQRKKIIVDTINLIYEDLDNFRSNIKCV